MSNTMPPVVAGKQFFAHVTTHLQHLRELQGMLHRVLKEYLAEVVIFTPRLLIPLARLTMLLPTHGL